MNHAQKIVVTCGVVFELFLVLDLIGRYGWIIPPGGSIESWTSMAVIATIYLAWCWMTDSSILQKIISTTGGLLALFLWIDSKGKKGWLSSPPVNEQELLTGVFSILIGAVLLAWVWGPKQDDAAAAEQEAGGKMDLTTDGTNPA
ncbi:MAG: hypothetical protein VB835_06165 [Pirellulales bacterium]